MMLIILDKDPEESAKLLPDKIKFKQLIELCQLVCSAGISSVYKSIPQGKELQEWVVKNKMWTYRYMRTLWFWSILHLNVKPKTLLDTYKIKEDLWNQVRGKKRITYPKSAIFRYSKQYESNIPSKTELPLNDCIQEYKKYVQWKGETWGIDND